MTALRAIDAAAIHAAPAQPKATPRNVVTGVTAHLKHSAGQKVAAAAQRYDAAKAEQRKTRNAALGAAAACQAAQHSGATRRHELMLEHKAAQQRAEDAGLAAEASHKEFLAALREFENV